MHFADMGTSSMMAAGSHVRAIGWLDVRHPFPTGRLDAAVVDRIGTFAKSWRLSVAALEWPFAAGDHTCELCGSFDSSGNLGVPAGEILFVCPEMIAHYVGAHDYLPPKEFVEAIKQAPLPGSDEYTAAVSRFRNFDRAISPR